MLLSKRLWAVLLVGVLVAGLLVGFGDGDEAVAKEPRGRVGKVMVPAAAFGPTHMTDSYQNGGWNLFAEQPGFVDVVAPLSFPVPVRSIRRIAPPYMAVIIDLLCCYSS